MFIEQPIWLLRQLYPKAIWRLPTTSKSVYLTFDDGPIPQITPWVLDLLDYYQVKATFFCVGDNVQKCSWLYTQIVERGHQVGNHTFNHLQGFKVSKKRYLENVYQAGLFLKTDLFRPPHGQMRPSQYAALKKEYRIIMWDLVTRDYSNKLTGEQVFQHVKRYARNGSIITFHDSLKAENNLKYALPKSIEWLLEQGYEFKLL